MAQVVFCEILNKEEVPVFFFYPYDIDQARFLFYFKRKRDVRKEISEFSDVTLTLSLLKVDSEWQLPQELFPTHFR